MASQVRLNVIGREDREGKGAIWDIYTLRRYKICLIAYDEDCPQLRKMIAQKMRDYTFELPDFLCGWFRKGTLFVPGSAKNSKQPEIIKDAVSSSLQRGRPIIAVCAGANAVAHQLGMQTVKVEGHSSSSMMRLNNEGRVTYNPVIHSVVAKPGSLLADLTYPEFDVNSVHTIAIEPQSVKFPFQISGTSGGNLHLPERHHRNTSLLVSQSGTVEAVESMFGAPILLLQWHPEANINGANKQFRGLVDYMVLAGQAYAHRCQMLNELKQNNRFRRLQRGFRP
eukprot:GILK01011855.1.p1 GENE.GILK01011855.1~~GILK01011855.1.p1  ORF type:complete len:282 (-),score=8.89 GILK01011855.1:176-1021(-)